MMKVLIAGATGLVGSALIHICRDHNIPVNFLTTRRDKIDGIPDSKGFYWNPEKGEIDLDCFEGVTSIINLAGASISKRWTKSNKKLILDSRINSLRTLYEGLEKIDNSTITSFVSASAIGIYPNSLSVYYLEKEKETDVSFLGEVVEAWEKEIAAFKAFDLKVAKVRVGLVLSPDGGALPQMAKPVNSYLGAAFGSGKQWQSWIHIQDLADIFLYIIKNDLSGTYNGVAPNPITNSKLVKEIAEVLKKPLILPNIPQFVMKLALGEMAYLLFASQRVSSKKIEAAGFEFAYPNITSALRNIYLPHKEGGSDDVFFTKEYS